MLEVMRYNMKNNESSGFAFFDFSKAFDTFEPEILLNKLENSRSIFWSSEIILKGKKAVRFHRKFSIKKAMEHGVPQGSVRGPILFLV